MFVLVLLSVSNSKSVIYAIWNFAGLVQYQTIYLKTSPNNNNNNNNDQAKTKTKNNNKKQEQQQQKTTTKEKTNK